MSSSCVCDKCWVEALVPLLIGDNAGESRISQLGDDMNFIT